MLNIPKVSNVNSNFITGYQNNKVSSMSCPQNYGNNISYTNPSVENLIAYHPSFTAFWNSNSVQNNAEIQYNFVKSELDRSSVKKLKNLKQKGILENNNSNDGSTVLDNLYKIATKPRLQGLDKKVILAEVIKALDNPYSITQKFGDIPDKVAEEITSETGEQVPGFAKNVVSSACVAASMEFNLANRCPAEFARFAADLSGENYSVDKKLKITDFSEKFAEGVWKLREFNTTYKIDKNWEDVVIKLKPDRNAIIRARVQTSYKDPGERSCVDALIQSAILNFASQNTYNSITDERTGKYNPDKTGLTDFEKNFAEQVIFETPKFSVVYQDLDENGVLKGYNCTHEETKQHILKSLELGQNVIIGYTHINEAGMVEGGHEITIVGYEQDKNGIGSFICNDTDDKLDKPIKISEERLLPLIHHAGITKEALNPNDTIASSWKEHLAIFKDRLKQAGEINKLTY